MRSSAGPGLELALWREAREWWTGQSYMQFRTYVDAHGRRRTEERAGPSLGLLDETGQKPLDDKHREVWALKERKIRDEKVSRATGGLPQAYYDRITETKWSVAVRGGNTASSIAKDVERWGSPRQNRPHNPLAYAPLHCLSGYAFGRSSMLPEELGAYLALCGCPAAAIADPHSLVGCVEFAKACGRNGVKPLIGASFELPEGGEIVLIAKTKRGYVSLSRLVTECHLGEPRQFPLGSWERLERHSQDLICLTGGDVGPLDRLLVRRDTGAAMLLVERLIRIYGRENVFLEVERSFLPWQTMVERQLIELAEALNVLPVAGGVIVHGRREHFPAQDVLVCAESLCLIDEVIGRKPRRAASQPQIERMPERSLNAERYLRTAVEMATLYADRPNLTANTLRAAEKCEEDVLPARSRLPGLFEDDDHALREIVEAEAHFAYGSDLSDKHKQRLKNEVDRIVRLGFSSHFLIAWDFCRFAQEQGIGMSGRGSVVDSAVAYVLGLSRIDAIEHNLHFERFLSDDGKRPDIDVDFEAHRRDDIRGYLVRKYGVERVAAVAAVGSYRTRGIVRDVGKVFGLPEETIGFLAKRIHGGVSADHLEAALQGRPELRDSHIPKEQLRWIIALAERLMDLPTNIRTHSSGVVISEGPLRDAVPLMWSATPVSEESGVEESQLRMIQWDKRSSKHFFDKFDILCLRGQDVLGGVERRVRVNAPDFSVHRLDATKDPEVYRAMRSGELIGIPQSASPAMRQAHVRLRTDDLHAASLVQAGIRPGVGGAVKLNELIARRHGKPYSFENDEFRDIFQHTYGIIVFQEQVDQLLERFCGYSSGQAEDIRDAIYKHRYTNFGETIREQLIERALARGFSLPVAEKVFEYVAGFKGYGFAQGHALAFAEISLRSVMLMQNYPAEYFAALLSAQPAGYYGPCTIANEARARGVMMLPIDVCASREKFEVEEAIDPQTGLRVPNGAIRTGLMQLSGLSKSTRERILEYQGLVGPRDPSAIPLPMRSVPPQESRAQPVATMVGRPPDEQTVPLLPFHSMFDFALKAQPERDELDALILAGAFDSLHRNRRALLWAVPSAVEYAKSLKSDGANLTLPLDMPEPPIDETIDDFSIEERAIWERALLGMDVQRHLMGFERERILAKGGLTTAEVRRLPAGSRAMVVGNPIRLRFPPTSSGRRVVFFDLEDETGLLNTTCFDETYQRDGHAIVTSQYVTALGTMQDRDGYPAFLATRVYPYRPALGSSTTQKLPIGSADFLVG